MIKYLRCHECKEDVITEIEQEYSATTVPCKGCGRIKLWWYFIDLTDQEWAKEKIRQWTAKNKPPKFFDEDGDPVMELSNSIYDMEHYAYRKIQGFMDAGMTLLELRAFTERLINVVQAASNQHAIAYEYRKNDEASKSSRDD